MFDTERFICEIESQPPLYDVRSKEYSNRDVKAKCWVKVAEALYEDWSVVDIKTKDERVRELMKTWKAIRDCFVRDHRSISAVGTGQAASKKKKYVYYEQLLFLLTHVKSNMNTSSNITPSDSQDLVGVTRVNENALDESLNESLSNVTSPINDTSSDNRPKSKSLGLKRKASSDPSCSKRATLEKGILSSSKELTSILASSLEWQKEEKNSDKFGNKAFLQSFVPVLDSMPFSSSMYIREQISQLFSNYFNQNERQIESLHSSTSASAATTPLGANDESLDYNISDYLRL